MILFYLIAFASWLIFLAFLIILRVGLYRLPKSKICEDDDKLPTASVVVAARDEEKYIGRLIDCLIEQDFPKDKFEIIVVDDRSTDSTSDIVLERKNSDISLRVIKIREEDNVKKRAPKKYALSRGIGISKNEIIVTTDADCWMGNKWLRTIVTPFINPKVGGATGVSRFIRESDQPSPWWSDYESLEHISYSVFAAGCIGTGHVMNAHGSNLAARRTCYDKVEGYKGNDRVTSGDDVFLLQNISSSGYRVTFIDREEGFVYSRPVDSARQWINQRARWTSKNYYYPKFLGILVYGLSSYFVSTLLSIPLAMAGRINGYFAIFMISLRLIFETFIIRNGVHRFGESFSSLKYIFTIFLHSFAIILAGIRGQFFSFSWKGSTYRGAEGNKNSAKSGS